MSDDLRITTPSGVEVVPKVHRVQRYSNGEIALFAERDSLVPFKVYSRNGWLTFEWVNI
jgi:hypothetical protein